jgi:hypothetical protein
MLAEKSYTRAQSASGRTDSSFQIPVVWAAVDCTSLTGFIPNDHSGAIKYLPRSGKEIWSATSHNWWFQGQLAHALDAFPGFDALRYRMRANPDGLMVTHPVNSRMSSPHDGRLGNLEL